MTVINKSSSRDAGNLTGHRAWRFAALICAAAMLAGCDGRAPGADGPAQNAAKASGGDIIARVNGSPIYASDLNAAANAAGLVQDSAPITPDNPLYEDMRADLIDQRLFAQKAVAKGLDKSPEAQRRLQSARERILGAILVEDVLAETVTEAAAKKLYGAQMALRDTSEEVRASHILVETEAEAKAVLARIKGGEVFSDVAFELSKDESSRLNGGDLGYFQRSAMVELFSESVFALKASDAPKVFETEYGWHIAKVTDRRASPLPSFESMREELFAYLTYDELKKLSDDLREGADISFSPNAPSRLIPQTRIGSDSAPEPQDLPAELGRDSDNSLQDEPQ